MPEAVKEKIEQDKIILVHFDGPDDPENPMVRVHISKHVEERREWGRGIKHCGVIAVVLVV